MNLTFLISITKSSKDEIDLTDIAPEEEERLKKVASAQAQALEAQRQQQRQAPETVCFGQLQFHAEWDQNVFEIVGKTSGKEVKVNFEPDIGLGGKARGVFFMS